MIMSTVARREPVATPSSSFGIIDQLFDDWMRSLPTRRPFDLAPNWPDEELIRVDQYREDAIEVIRAEMPGIDPDKDVEITITGGMLQIHAGRRVEDKTEDNGYNRREIRYGAMSRTLPLPEGTTEADITATYRDGILEIRVPVSRSRPAPAPIKIPVANTEPTRPQPGSGQARTRGRVRRVWSDLLPWRRKAHG
jgi:HSP20 family protein